MKERNFVLFAYLKSRDLPRFKAELKLTFEDLAELKLTLTPEDVAKLKLTPETVAKLTPDQVASLKQTPEAFGKLIPGDVRMRHRESLLYYGNRNSPQPFLGYEHQDYCLLHEAVRQRFYEAVELILEKGGDLLQTEEINNDYYTREDWGKELKVRNEKIVLPTALSLIVESGDKKLLQIAFDCICKQKLYLEHESKPEYLQFIYDHFWDLNSSHFTARCLCFDVGRPLPAPFVTPKHLKQYLTDKGFDVRGIFFTAEDYLDYFFRYSDYITKPLLSRALSVCQFPINTLRELYNAFKTEELKTLVVNYNPTVDPEFAARFAVVPKKIEQSQQRDEKEYKKPAPHIKPDITPQLQKQYRHYRKRVGFLDSRITELTQEQERLKNQTQKKRSRDLGKKEKQELVNFQSERTEKELWLSNNPQYKTPDDSAGDERERPPERSFFSHS